jgi:single-stranded DNA-binding protein
MTLAKATVSGTVYRQPEQRYTQNNIEVWGFTLNIDDREETLIRVISKRKALSDVLSEIKVGDRVLVDGKLQVASSKSPEGTDRKYFEIDANDIEKLGAGNMNVSVNESLAQTVEAKESVVSFEDADFTEESIIDSEEIPF